MIMAGRTYTEISKVVLAFKKGSTVNHIQVARELLQTVSSVQLQVCEAV